MNTQDLIWELRNNHYKTADLSTKSNPSTFLRCAASVAQILYGDKTYEQIGKEIDRDHSSISHYKTRVHPVMMDYKRYALCFHDACSIVRENGEDIGTPSIDVLHYRLRNLQREQEEIESLIEKLAV
jgi:hypothetical protein